MTNALKSNLKNPILGITKDGRPIYGAVKSYNADTNAIKEYTPCDLDVCNGRIEKIANGDQVYTYHASTFHPYLPTCFGPGQSP